jgi:N6-adenosine-specific RNA methylase IME4
LEEIKAIRVPAAPDWVLFLWATAPMLPQALEVMAAWGFSYRSHFIWEKGRIGLGYGTRNVYELLLIGTRSDVPAPLPGQQLESIIQAPRGAHSGSPMWAPGSLSRCSPTCRGWRCSHARAGEGWDVWGNEAPPDSAPTAASIAPLWSSRCVVPPDNNR